MLVRPSVQLAQVLAGYRPSNAPGAAFASTFWARMVRAFGCTLRFARDVRSRSPGSVAACTIK